MAKISRYYEFEVKLLEVKPAIWRSFLLRSNSSFYDLHDTIQKACGWDNYHLFEFRTTDGNRSIATSPNLETDPYSYESAPVANELKLDDYFDEIQDKCIYIYDFGDYWEHLVTLKQTQVINGSFKRKLTGGKRAFPLEDCGGTPGYENCIEALSMTEKKLSNLDEDEKEEFLHLKEWSDGWNPEFFDFEQTAKRLKRPVSSDY